ncbi:diguanylate cyclase [Massilia cellulosiltytica]|uniref:sensor domain-containing diguanylate cyclase n=1 Tax=Massilia cellulosiltytica TaxID=2683234 RepID=UPI0039B55350
MPYPIVRFIYKLRSTVRRLLAQPLIPAIHCVLVGLILFSSGIEYWGRERAYRNQLAESTVAGKNIAQGAIQYVDLTLNSVTWVLDGLVERVETDGVTDHNRARIKRFMLSRIAKKTSPLQGLFVYDRDGRWIVSTAEPAQPDANNADRPYFAYHRTHPDRGVHVGSPVRSRSTGDWVIPVSRRVNDPDGQFAGVVLATIPVDYFTRYCRQIGIGRNGAILLALDDGTVITRLPENSSAIGSDVRTTPLFQYALRSRQDHGTVLLTTRYDQQERLHSFQRSRVYPLLFSASLGKDDIFADWREMTVQEVGAVAAMLLIVSAVAMWLVTQLRARARLETALRDAHAALELRNATLDHLARTDGLTGLHNRRYLDERLDAELSRAARECTSIALIMIDVDYFKRYNDTHGHAAGDVCLRSVAQAIGTTVRRPADVAARFGGEEFAVLLPNTDQQGALSIAESIRRAVEGAAMPHGGSELHVVTISAGVAVLQPDAATVPRTLIESADAALYAAKLAGRNNVQH